MAGPGAVVKQHPPMGEASPWVIRFAPLIRPGGLVLDYACGSGRHARRLAAQGFRVEAADRDAAALRGVASGCEVRVRELDLEGAHWPFDGERYDGVVVTNYLFRPYFARMLDLVGDDGVLIYETFMLGNERFGRPRSPEFLLAPGELLERLRNDFSIVAFEQGEVGVPGPAMIQRVCAIRGPGRTVSLPSVV